MTLPEVLYEVILLLRAQRDFVVITRGQDRGPLDGRSQAFQLKLRRGVFACQCEARSWLGDQWSIWQEQRGWLGGGGFDVADAIATDWRISP